MERGLSGRYRPGAVMPLQAGAARTRRPVLAPAGRAAPAGGVSEPPRPVRSQLLVVGADLAGGQRDPRERRAQLPDRPGGANQRAGHGPASAARPEDLSERELVGGLSVQPASGEIQAG